MSSERLLKLRVTLKGRPVRTYAFNKETVMVGRDPSADVFLDNPGISREHLKMQIANGGEYEVQDLGSANGALLNDAPLRRQVLSNNDVIQIGKYALWVTYEEDRRGDVGPQAHASPTADDRTVVLSSAEIEGMMKRARASEAEAQAGSSGRTVAAPVEKKGRTARTILAFFLGSVLGVGIALYVTMYLKR